MGLGEQEPLGIHDILSSPAPFSAAPRSAEQESLSGCETAVEATPDSTPAPTPTVTPQRVRDGRVGRQRRARAGTRGNTDIREGGSAVRAGSVL